MPEEEDREFLYEEFRIFKVPADVRSYVVYNDDRRIDVGENEDEY